jgi:hypothetical protein
MNRDDSIDFSLSGTGSISMSNNNSNSSTSSNYQNSSAFLSGGQSENNNSASISVSDYIMMPCLSLTILFALGYSILLIVHPTFRANKLNWFTINVCVTTMLLSGVMISMSIMKFTNTSGSLPCRTQSYLNIMAACQMMYSHSVVAVSRFLTIVYSNKRIFRSTACVWISILVGWVVAFLIALPFAIQDGFACSRSTRVAFLPYYILFGILIIPVMIVAICNIRILLFVRRSSQRVRTEGRAKNNVSQARDIRLIKTMVITFTVFVIGWVPLFVEQVFNNTISVPSSVDTIFQILPQFSMFFDIILLIITNQPVRLLILQLIRRRHQIAPMNPTVNTIPNQANALG